MKPSHVYNNIVKSTEVWTCILRTTEYEDRDVVVGKVLNHTWSTMGEFRNLVLWDIMDKIKEL